MRSLRWFVLVTLFAALALPTLASAQDATAVAGNATGRVTVLGSGSVTAKPDTASFTLGAEATRPTVPEALEESNAKLAAIIAAVKEAGVAAGDIQTAYFSVYSVRDYSKQESQPIAPIVGYTVSNQVSVTIRNIDWQSGLPSEEIGAVIGAAIEAGATDVYSVSFSVSDPTAAEREARELAVQNASDRAGQLAAIAGKEVGQVIAMSEGVSYAPLGYGYGYGESDGLGGGGGAPIYGGTVEIVVDVTVAFELI